MEMLKFCYLSLVIVFLSCSGASEKKKDVSNDVPEIIDQDKKLDVRKKTILFFGNSLTAGMGLDPQEAFPALIQDRIDSLGYLYTVINSGLSGETTASGKNRLDWVLKQQVDVFVLELGANDGLRGIPLSETRRNLQDIIDRVKGKNADTVIILAGMMIPPNIGLDYSKEFQSIFPTLADENDVLLIPFILQDVAGNPELNQRDGIHPTIEGQKIVANNVWLVLNEVLQ